MITSSFNRFYHAILNEAFVKARQISFREWKNTDTGGCLIFYKDEDYSDMDELKQIFKLMNVEYKVDGEKKLSTAKINSKALCEHIVWVTKILNENGITFKHDDEEWERILFEANHG